MHETASNRARFATLSRYPCPLSWKGWEGGVSVVNRAVSSCMDSSFVHIPTFFSGPKPDIHSFTPLFAWTSMFERERRRTCHCSIPGVKRKWRFRYVSIVILPSVACVLHYRRMSFDVFQGPYVCVCVLGCGSSVLLNVCACMGTWSSGG